MHSLIGEPAISPTSKQRPCPSPPRPRAAFLPSSPISTTHTTHVNCTPRSIQHRHAVVARRLLRAHVISPSSAHRQAGQASCFLLTRETSAQDRFRRCDGEAPLTQPRHDRQVHSRAQEERQWQQQQQQQWRPLPQPRLRPGELSHTSLRLEHQQQPPAALAHSAAHCQFRELAAAPAVKSQRRLRKLAR